MRGLPAVPEDVAQLTLRWLVDGSPSTTAHWVFIPGLPALDFAGLEPIRGDIVFAAFAGLVPLLPDAGELSTCRLARLGSSPLAIDGPVAPNTGALGDSSTLNAATPIHWLTTAGPSSSHALTRLPGFPDVFSTDKRSILPVSQAQIANQASVFRDDVGAIASPLGGSCALVTLHRQHAGVPLAVAQVVPIVKGLSGRRVATLRRRLNAR